MHDHLVIKQNKDLLLFGDAYDMEKHLGGVWYVFLRGVDGSGNHGFFRDRPPRGLIEALDEAIGGKGRP